MLKRARQAIDHDLALLFAVMLVIGGGNTALQSIMPALGRSLGVDDHYIAAAFSVSAFVWMFAAPYWARRSDRSGRKAMVLTGVTGFIASVILCALCLSAGIMGWISPTLTIILFIVARMVYGLFGAAAPPAAQAILAGQTSREDRTRALTLLASAFGLGTIIGPAFAPLFVLPPLGLAGPAYAFAGIATLVLIAVWRGLPDDAPLHKGRGRGAVSSYPSIASAPTGASVRAASARSDGADAQDQSDGQSSPPPAQLPLFDRHVWPWLLVGLIAGHAQAMGGQAVGFLVIDRLELAPLAAQGAITIVLMGGAACALLVQWGLIPMLDLAPGRLIQIGLTLAAIGCMGVAFAHSLYGIVLAFGCTSAGFGFVRPGYTAGASLAVGQSLQALVAGRVTSVNGAAFVLGPTLGVSLYQWNGGLPYWVGAGLCLATLVYALVAIPRQQIPA